MKYSSIYWNDVSYIAQQIPKLNNLFGKQILITGSTGMVCSSVVDIISYLNKEKNANIGLILAGRNRQRIVSRFDKVLKNNEINFIEYDATKSQHIEKKVDYIIHGASNANPAVYAKEPVETLLGNIIGLNNLLELSKVNQGSRLLYISSSEVYGNRTENKGVPYKEEDYGFVDILNPRACYPNGKRTAETLCVCYNQEFGVDFVIIRPGHIYGPSITKSDTRASASFTRDVVAGRNIVMKSAGNQIRSYCYTLDCASAILTILINGETGHAYNISNKNSIVSIREIAEAFAKAGGVNVIYENSSDVELKSYNLMDNSSLDAKKLESLGWKAIIDLNDGVKKTLENY